MEQPFFDWSLWLGSNAFLICSFFSKGLYGVFVSEGVVASRLTIPKRSVFFLKVQLGQQRTFFLQWCIPYPTTIILLSIYALECSTCTIFSMKKTGPCWMRFNKSRKIWLQEIHLVLVSISNKEVMEDIIALFRCLKLVVVIWDGNSPPWAEGFSIPNRGLGSRSTISWGFHVLWFLHQLRFTMGLVAYAYSVIS